MSNLAELRTAAHSGDIHTLMSAAIPSLNLVEIDYFEQHLGVLLDARDRRVRSIANPTVHDLVYKALTMQQRGAADLAKAYRRALSRTSLASGGDVVASQRTVPKPSEVLVMAVAIHFYHGFGGEVVLPSLDELLGVRIGSRAIIGTRIECARTGNVVAALGWTFADNVIQPHIGQPSQLNSRSWLQFWSRLADLSTAKPSGEVLIRDCERCARKLSRIAFGQSWRGSVLCQRWGINWMGG